ncbi:MAG: chromate efflux transporter [Geminicoccaceae bacterium]|nr:chromate efflux transporter [Geminicoccaceae bacterium]
MSPSPPGPPSLAEAARTWARIGLLSFGGPAGQIALLHRVLVEEKGWLDERRFLHALQVCMLLPGPEAHQLVVYTGRLLHGVRGGIVAGALFVLPGLLAILVLSLLYVTLGTLPLLQAALLGLRAAVIAIVLEAVFRIGRRMLGHPAMVGLALLAFLALFAFRIPFPAVVLAAGLLGWLGGRLGLPSFLGAGLDHGPDPPELARSGPDRTGRLLAIGLALWLAPLVLAILLLGPGHPLVAIGRLASELALLGFGGAYAVLAYTAQVAVEHHGWLAPSEMLDGLALAEAVPGPLVLVLAFVGFLAAFRGPAPLDSMPAGILGGGLAAWAIFVPSCLLALASVPYSERVRRHATLSAVLAAIGAAACGAIAFLALRFALHGVFLVVETVRFGPLALELPVLASWNPVACLLALLALVAVFRFRLALGPLLLGGAGAGVVLYLLRFELLGFL